MSLGIYKVPVPKNETVRDYAPGSPERATLKAKLAEMASERVEIPLVIGGKEIRTGRLAKAVMPHEHGHVLADVHLAGPEEIALAIEAAGRAKDFWSRMPWEERVAIFLKAADLLAGPYRDVVNAATMLGQSKTCQQAEIDSAAETIDFFRFNAHYYAEILTEQPESGPGMWNRMEHRPLEGFVFAVSPFNFTAIGSNLAAAPALCGNTVLWKPASSALFSAYHLTRLYRDAGMPDGVINMIPGSGRAIGDVVLSHQDLAGIHFTGSTGVFNGMWRTVGQNLEKYRSYPRLVGETGGKDFIFAHPSADPKALVTAILRGAFEYQGQKCSAASRAYVPSNLWAKIKDELIAEVEGMKVGDPQDFGNFMGAVIDEAAFNDHREAIDAAKASKDAKIVAGGTYDSSVGWFVRPTLIQALDPSYHTMSHELFGPILSIHVYDESKWEEMLDVVDATSPYALTGAVFSQDRYALHIMVHHLRHAAGNFYINDKPTGAVVGQQPFGGARMSGTNDKAGSSLNLLRWISPRTIKETFVPATDWRYPYLG